MHKNCERLSETHLLVDSPSAKGDASRSNTEVCAVLSVRMTVKICVTNVCAGYAMARRQISTKPTLPDAIWVRVGK